MLGKLRTQWTAYQQRGKMCRLRENMAYFGFSLSQYSDEQLLSSLKTTPTIMRTSCTTPSEAAFIFQKIAEDANDVDRNDMDR